MKFFRVMTSMLVACGSIWAAGNGLKGEYFANTGLAGTPATVRTDGTVNFDWPGPPTPGLSNSYFSVRWSGKVEAPVTGAYRFATYSNEAVRVWVNGTRVINNWSTHWTDKDVSAPVNLTAGQQYDLKVEYREGSGAAIAKLLWSYPGQDEVVIPQTRLYSPAVAAVEAPAYLSEMTPALSQSGWGPYERDRSNGELRLRDGHTIELNDIKYGRGLGVHAKSDLRYQLMGRYKTFLTDIGVDDEVNGRGSVVFEVWLDGVRKYASPVMKGTDAAVPLVLDITGVRELKLIVLDGGDGLAYDHADWAGARVSTGSAVVTPPPPPPPTNTTPSTPTGLTAVPGNGQVSLQWNASSGATGYKLYRSVTQGMTGEVIASGLSITSFVNTSLTNGTMYFFKVVATNGALSSTPSSEVPAKPVAPVAVPVTPTELTAVPGNSQVTLKWKAVSGATGYNLFRSTTADGAGTPITSGVQTTTFTNTGLTNGTFYYFRVAATNPAGSSAPTAAVMAKPVAPEPPPAAPTGLAATAGNAQVTLNWNAVAGATGYNVFRSTTAGAAGTQIATGLTLITFVNTGLTNGTTYFFKVVATGGTGTSAPSNEASAKPVAPQPPPAPTELTATPGDVQVGLSWTASTGATSYSVFRGTASGAQGDTPLATSITGTTYKDTAVTNGTTYFYKVAAVNANGTGAKSGQASAKPAPPPPPGAPTGFAASGGDSRVTLTWTAVTGAASYNVFRGIKSGQQGDIPFATGVLASPWTDTGLTNGTTYYYKLVAVSPAGTSPKSAERSALPSAPATVLTPTQMSAFKFLRQSTWGPTPTLVNHVAQVGKAAFLDEQFALPATPYSQALEDMPNMELVSEQFFQNALQGQDQLRQRVAWALSQIWVVSAVKVDNTHAMVPYIRTLEENAFGNVRDVLEKITLTPAMGEFLDMVNNKKGTGTAMPNENYARELMQLFTIGLSGLNPDGTSTGGPTYTQNDVLEMARVLTGWTYGDAVAGDPTRINNRYYAGPMEPVAAFHDTTAKLVMGMQYPANQTARMDLKQALDQLFNHPNMGPFLVKQLIQRLVKSSPSPRYMADVVAVFNNNGQGVRGDLRAIVRAILLHPEAATTPDTGKFSEPALFLTTLARGLNSTVVDHPYMTDFSQDMSQRIWFAPSVFNYFSPGYRSSAVPGGVAGPELQIWSTATAMTRTNFVAALVSGGFGTNFTIDMSPYQAVVGSPEALVDQANANLMGGTMGPEMRQAILTALAASTNSTDRIRAVLYLVGSSMQYQVEH